MSTVVATPSHSLPGSRELTLIGGGHAHVLLLRKFGEEPLRDVRLTMVSDIEHAAYSGMLPGHIGGVYGWAEMHIDLRRLCSFAGARFIHARACGLDLRRKHVLISDGTSPLPTDLVSINVGGTPCMSTIAGIDQRVIPSKPVSRLLAGWESVKATVRNSMHPPQIVIVGGGAGGVELALAMHSQLRAKAEFIIIQRGPHLLPGHNLCAQRILTRLLRERKLTAITNAQVVEVTPDKVRLNDGRLLTADFIFWATQTAPPAWLAKSGLDTAPEGFLRIKPTLQTINYPWIFAAGDVAAIEHQKLPKSGVFAVRMAKTLGGNLRAYLSGRVLGDYQPQRYSLSLIGTADGRAVASYGCIAAHSTHFWRWKDQIDRRFMRQFQELPV